MPFTHDIADYPEGIVLAVDKPYRWTSADVIRKLKFAAIKHFGKKNLKVGHAGTLDPLATGVLLVCIGPACKRAQELQDHDKEYIARIRFGATTPSYDLEKDVDRHFPFEHITRADVEAALPAFLGEQEQVAPLFSAKSVDGVRAYEMARKAYQAALRGEGGFDHGATELLSKQRIRISELELLEWSDCQLLDSRSASAVGAAFPERGEINRCSDCTGIPAPDTVPGSIEARVNPKINVISLEGLALPCARIRIACTKGTYIRALARDLGEALGSGAFLGSLRRTRTGGFRVEDALTLSETLAILGPASQNL